MTQEELDALMNGDTDLDSEMEESSKEESNVDEDGIAVDAIKADNYKTNSNTVWPPPPPNEEHKVVHQLDDVTRDSEKKATEIMDKLENISNFFADSESLVNNISKIFDKNIEIFTKLNEKFPNVNSFIEALEANKKSKENISALIDDIQNGQDEVMMTMDAMQYQDIHRQKIERVINVMRALSRYMSSLFEGKIDDQKRVSSAVHIEGDSTADLVSNDDIEALISSLGQK